MLYFNRENQEQIFLNNLPKGKVFKQAKMKGTNFNKIIKWVAKGFEWLVDKYNQTFKGLFICESKFFIEQFKKDYSIPNKIFYQATDDEHQQDIKVLKYLMRGNTKFNFQMIAQMYDVCVKIETGVEHFKDSRLPNKVPHRIYSSFENENNILVVIFNSLENTTLPYRLPHYLTRDLKIEKIKNIYDIIKPSQVKILYLSGLYDIELETIKDILPSSVPHRLGDIIISNIVYKEQEQCKKIEICVKGL